MALSLVCIWPRIIWSVTVEESCHFRCQRYMSVTEGHTNGGMYCIVVEPPYKDELNLWF